MENQAPPPRIKMTWAIPADLAQALDEERMRLAGELRTRLSSNQMAARVIALGIEASRNS
jgi:hypothetical protein